MIELNKLMQAQFDKMCATGKLFRSNITGQKVWELYIEGFGNDPIFRDPESSVHNCNLCNNFIRRYGNIVAIDSNNDIITIFDINPDLEYKNSIQTISNKLKVSEVSEVFFETFAELNSLPYESCTKTNAIFKLGIDKNIKRYTKEEAEKFGVVKPNEIRTFNHFNLKLPKQFVDMSGRSIEAIMADYRDAKNAFTRAMVEISLDTYKLMIDLIKQDSLLSSSQYIPILNEYIKLKEEYNKVSNKDNWCWLKSYELGGKSKFLGSLQGTFLKEISEGKELNSTCEDYNKRIDPTNYGKAKKPLTEAMKKAAMKIISELGCEESFIRRHSTIDDIDVSEIKHVNIGDSKIKEASLFDGLKTISTRHKRSEFDGVQDIHVDKFMTEILPQCTSIELYLENKHEANLCNLTTAINKNAPNIFKYSNLFSKTFNGNLAGKSNIKETVKIAGGKVDGVLRFSIMWSGDNIDDSDLDAHCIEPDNNRIYYGRKISYKTKGNLDIDIQRPLSQMKNGAVENITYPILNKMLDGNYRFLVNQYSSRNSKGFKAEIEFNGEQFYYEYNKPVSGSIEVATVNLKNGIFTITHHLQETNSNKEIYCLETNKFHKVNLVCLSPNYWGNNNIGIKHYMFMLENCKTDKPIVSFHTEDLLPELAKNNAAMRDLSYITMIEPVDKQLAGLGFNASVRDEVILKLSGSHKRIIKLKF